jgi:hypothetical protein
MWGKERGSIEINQNTEFGYVLPGTVRKFQFSWKGEKNPFEVGRYKAVATLAYGQDSRQNVYAVTYFWIVPLKPTLGILGGLAIFLFVTLRIIRVYIKKALQKEAARLGIAPTDAATGTRAQARANSMGNSAAYGRSPRTGRPLTFAGYVKEHALLIAVLAIFAAGLAGFAIYFTQVLKSERDYEVILQRNDGTMQVVPGSGSSATPAAQGNSRE